MEEHGARLPPETLQMGPAVFLVHGQKALKGKPSRGQTGHRQRVDKGTGAGDGNHGNLLRCALGHQFLSRVTDGGSTGIGDQGAALTPQQAGDQFLSPGSGIVAVVTHHRLLQPQMVEELHRHPGVLGGDEIHLLQGLRRPERQIPQVANGGGDQI